MPTTPEIDRKIRLRFIELLGQAESLDSELLSTDYFTVHRHIPAYESLLVNTQNLIRMVFADSKQGKEYQDNVKKMSGQRDYDNNTKRIIGILRGLEEDYKGGYIKGIEELIIANVSADYMRQARLLLDQGESENLDHVLSAVVCGVVLENGLRWLCTQQAPEIKTVRRNGQPKRLNALVEDLQKAKAFNALKGDQLRSWAKIRNHAAHGETDQFSRQDVQTMINGVTDFMAGYVYGT